MAGQAVEERDEGESRASSRGKRGEPWRGRAKAFRDNNLPVSVLISRDLTSAGSDVGADFQSVEIRP